MKCPFAALTPVNRAVTDNNALWFPERLNLSILKDRPTNHPFPDFDYPQAFAQLDLQAVQTDIESVLTTSQEWWPADYGHYGGLFIRQAWHQAGTYRVSDGRGGANTGNQRFPPLNSWPDNANLDKARRLLWPIKKKYGQALSWADLFMLTGNQALQSMGVEPFGFGGGRIDTYSPEDDVYWGPETELLDNERYHVESGTLDEPFGASVMGLIYVNPEGPNGDPNPAESAQEIRATFRNMAMNDEETVALIAGGHTFGKSHGVASETNQGPSPEVAGLELQGLGYAAGKGKDTITSGIEGAWTQNPTQWDNQYFNNLFNYEWECHEGPGGRSQWRPIGDDIELVPDAHVPGKFDKPMMMTTDISLKVDPEYRKIAKRFHENPDQLKQVFARVWYKLTHRDMGPATRLVGADVAPPQIWQDPIPSCDHPLLNDQDRDLLSQAILDHDELTIPKLVRVAWGSASTFRRTDYRGGANGARIRLRPQKDWAVNQPQELSQVLSVLQSIQKDFNDGQQKNGSDKRVSMADLIVLGGCTAIQSAAHQAGHTTVRVPFVPGRMDASMEETDADAFDPMEPKSDGFRNHYDPDSGYGRKPEEILVDRAHLLGLTAPEMTVLVGGLRALGATTSDKVGLLTEKPGQLSNDFFVNLLDMETEWSETKDSNNLFEGRDRSTGDLKWQGSRVDLIFGSHSELRAISEFYACSDSEAKFVTDFVGAWTKVMNADRYDLDNRLLPNSVENRLNSQSHQEAALV